MDHRRHPADTEPTAPPDGPAQLSAVLTVATAQAEAVLSEAEGCLVEFSRGFRSYLGFMLEMQAATMRTEALTQAGFEGLPRPFGSSAAIEDKIRSWVRRGLAGGFLRADDPLVAPLLTPASPIPNAKL